MSSSENRNGKRLMAKRKAKAPPAWWRRINARQGMLAAAVTTIAASGAIYLPGSTTLETAIGTIRKANPASTDSAITLNNATNAKVSNVRISGYPNAIIDNNSRGTSYDNIDVTR